MDIIWKICFKSVRLCALCMAADDECTLWDLKSNLWGMWKFNHKSEATFFTYDKNFKYLGLFSLGNTKLSWSMQMLYCIQIAFSQIVVIKNTTRYPQN